MPPGEEKEFPQQDLFSSCFWRSGLELRVLTASSHSVDGIPPERASSGLVLVPR